MSMARIGANHAGLQYVVAKLEIFTIYSHQFNFQIMNPNWRKGREEAAMEKRSVAYNEKNSIQRLLHGSMYMELVDIWISVKVL